MTGTEKENVDPRKILVLVSGKARHGKDTFADGLSAALSGIRGDGRTFEKMSFATELKRKAAELGWNGEKDEKGRRFLQELGTVCRNYDRDVWVKMLIRSAESQGALSPFVAIADCRYPNEIELMREWGGRNGYSVHTVRIERPGFESGLSAEAQAHTSETALDSYSFDLHLVNDASTAKEFQSKSFRKWAEFFREDLPALTHKWNVGDGIEFIHGSSADMIRSFRERHPGTIVSVDYDDTLLEKTGELDRTPFFRRLCGDTHTVVVTARSERVEEIAEFAKRNGLKISGIIYDAGAKGHVLDILRPLCHFDDDPGVAGDVFGTGVPVFTMGEFSSPEYRRLWVDRVRSIGEEKFYVQHAPCGICLEDIVRSKGSADSAYRFTLPPEKQRDVDFGGITMSD